MKKQWQQKEQAPKEFGEQFPEFSAVTRQLLWQRGLQNQKEIDEFFNPDYSQDLHDPFLLKDADKAVERIFKALKEKERVMVYGDYDSDGVSGATIIYNALKRIGFIKDNLAVYLPDREKEGYGLNVQAVKQFGKEKYNLIITVDCGTTSFEPIKLANKKGIDVIVTDHHRVIDNPPEAYAFVNPHQEDDKYPFKDLCGAAVAFKIACALYKKADIPEGEEKWFLDLVALATVTDVMPLLGENRTLVKYGLFVLAQTERLGLKALMEVSGIKATYNQDSLSTNLRPWTLGFILGPRLNAAGRMDHANTAFALLNATSYDEALSFARQIDERNRERQQLVGNILKEAEKRLEIDKSPVIFEGDKNWPIGVLGIVAGRLADKYHKPAFIYQIKDDNNAAGSVRTILGFHVVHAFESVKDLLVNFGGHPAAGGFTVSQDKLGEMKKRIEEFAKENLKKEDFVKKTEYCAEASPEDISWQVYEELERFEPFGEANKEPIFLLRGVKILNLDKIGKDNGNGNGKKHLRFLLDISGTKRKAMGFSLGNRFEELSLGESMDILFNLAIDEWNGNRELMLRVVDFKVNK
ncbi:MAG: single-stranded-DNA-specific exonuclease RecJ [Candidatus Spechtbacterales bacterium]